MRRLAAAALCVTALSLTGLYWCLASGLLTSRAALDSAAAMPPLPPIGSSPFLNTAADVAFTGTQRCAACHPQQHASYLQTVHSQALGETIADREPPDGEFLDPATGRQYSVARREGQLWHTESLSGTGPEDLVLAEFPARYTIGSGHFSRSYLMETDGFLVQSPVTWYAGRPGWALSPGYDRHNPGFERPIVAECVNCHVGRSETMAGTLQKFRFHSTAIDCERCHGPGELHASRHEGAAETITALAGALDTTIVNPSRLSRELAEDICAQCHFHTGATVELRGRRLTDYRPGLCLQDFAVHVARKSKRSTMRVVGHVEQMRESRCYQESETLTCTTCHDPHRSVPPEERVERQRQICLTCHETQACGLPHTERTRQNPADDCAACHMPRGATEIPHFAFTQHRIGMPGRTDSAGPAEQVGELQILEHVPDLPEAEVWRVLGLAALQLLSEAGSPEQAAADEARAVQWLEQTRAAGLEEANLNAALARLYWRRDPVRSRSRAEAVLQDDSASAQARTTAQFTLATTHMDAGQSQQALPLFEALVQSRLYSEDWYLLSLARLQTGKLAEALPAAHRAAAISPQYPQLQEHLARLSALQGNPRQAAEYRERAARLRSLQPPASGRR